MDALEAAGDREDAIRVGKEHIAVLKRELDAEPSPLIAELLQRLRNAPAPVNPPEITVGLPTRCDLDGVRAGLEGRYDVVEELGEGVMAKVFLAWDSKLRRHVAVKVLKPKYRRTVGADRFLREISIIAEFNHPNIVTLFEADEMAGFLYYAMQHIPGETVETQIRRNGSLGIHDAVRITCDVAAGLEYCHRRPVIHRDVKPANILQHEGVALIADFGVAVTITAGGKPLTESGLMIGTPECMSPEQADPEARIDGRSDIYGLGCVLYEMLTGEPVYTGATPRAVIAKHRFESIPSVGILRDVSEKLEAIVTTALAKRPGDRFQHAADFAAALRACDPIH